jgi:hypothetical protein
MLLNKIQDVGKGLAGRQEEYWKYNLLPKYQNYRPGFKFSYKNPEDLIKENKFVALEFGHWTTQNERYDFLAAADASFSDMKKITGIKYLGCNKIGVAFGARGKGGSAMAHFEPGSFMINLTRNKGLGSFAHEYGHALDYFFGGYIEQDRDSFALSGGRTTAKTRDQKWYPGSLHDLMDRVIYNVIWETHNKPSKSFSNFPSGEYWFRRNEIFARTFEQWVLYQLAQKGIKNVFLTDYKYEDKKAYLTGEDFKRVLPHMNKLIKAIAIKSR